MRSPKHSRVVLGQIGGAHGVRGWVRAISYTEPPEGLGEYRSLDVGSAAASRRLELEGSRGAGNAMLLKFGGVDDRDAAAGLAGAELAVSRAELPAPAEREYYWVDLVGIRVENLDGVTLGRVERLLPMPAQTVLVIGGERERLVPIVPGRTVRKIDLEAGWMQVDWDADW